MFDLKPFSRYWPIAICFAICPVMTTNADTFFRQVATTGPMEIMGDTQPGTAGTADTSVTWMAEDKVYTESSEGVTIARFDLGMIYMLDPGSKTYTEVSLDEFVSIEALMTEMVGGDDELVQMMAEMNEIDLSAELDQVVEDTEADSALSQMLEGFLQLLFGITDTSQALVTASVTPTDETGQFGQWEARKYLATMNIPMINEVTSEIWATEEIDVSYDRFMEASLGMVANWPGFDEAMREFEKIKGMAVYSSTSMNMMGLEMNIIAELIEYREAEPPVGIYEIPEGFSKMELGVVYQVEPPEPDND